MPRTRPADGVRVLTRRELNRALLARQLLLERVPMRPAAAIEHLVGLQGQTPPSPYTALWSRLEPFDPLEVSGLLEERHLVRTGLMRTTLHLVTARDALALWPVMQDVLRRVWGSTVFKRATAHLDIDAMLAIARDFLEARPATGTALRAELARHFPDGDPMAMALTCRFLLPLVQVPPRGLWGRTGQATNTTLEAWLGPAVLPPPDLEPIVLRYLAAFGPATVGDIRTWSWLTGLREVVERLRPRLVTYRDEAGRELFDVPDGVFADPDTPSPPRFLPDYDNLMLSHEDRSRVAPRIEVPLRQWLFGALLVDGFGRGTWRLNAKRGDAALEITVFEPLSPVEEAEVGAEGGRLAQFLAPGSRADIRIRFEELGAPSA